MGDEDKHTALDLGSQSDTDYLSKLTPRVVPTAMESAPAESGMSTAKEATPAISTVMDATAAESGNSTAMDAAAAESGNSTAMEAAVVDSGEAAAARRGLPPAAGFCGSTTLADPALEVVCNSCKRPMDPFARGVRLMSKQLRSFRCQVCNTKCSQLSTMFVGWPIDDFKRLSEEQKTAFWQSTGTSRHELKAAVEEQVVLTRIKSKWNGKHWDFQPLSWYRKNGYDTSTFSKNLEKEWNEDLGCMTYRVNIHGGGEKKMEELARQEMGKLLKDGEPKPKKARIEVPAAAQAVASGSPAKAVASGSPTAEADESGPPTAEDAEDADETRDPPDDDEPSSSQSSSTTTTTSSSTSTSERRHKLKRNGKKGKKNAKLSKKDKEKEKLRKKKEKQERKKKAKAEAKKERGRG